MEAGSPIMPWQTVREPIRNVVSNIAPEFGFNRVSKNCLASGAPARRAERGDITPQGPLADHTKLYISDSEHS